MSIYDVSQAKSAQLVNCFDCQHRDEVKLPAYISDGRTYPQHLCHNDRTLICKGPKESA